MDHRSAVRATAVAVGLALTLSARVAEANTVDYSGVGALIGVIALATFAGGAVALVCLVVALVVSRPESPVAAWKRRLGAVGVVAGWVSGIATVFAAAFVAWLADVLASGSERSELFAGIAVTSAVELGIAVAAVRVCGRLYRRNAPPPAP